MGLSYGCDCFFRFSYGTAAFDNYSIINGVELSVLLRYLLQQLLLFNMSNSRIFTITIVSYFLKLTFHFAFKRLCFLAVVSRGPLASSVLLMRPT